MTDKESKYLEEGMSVNYTEPISEDYKERARNMVEDTQQFDNWVENTVISNYGKVLEIIDSKTALIARNTFSGNVNEVVEISRLKFNDDDKQRVEKLIRRDDNLNEFLD